MGSANYPIIPTKCRILVGVSEELAGGFGRGLVSPLFPKRPATGWETDRLRCFVSHHLYLVPTGFGRPQVRGIDKGKGYGAAGRAW
jgi:hypothetical protein